MSDDLAVTKLSVDIADKLAGYAFQAWNFHIIGGIGMTGWAASNIGEANLPAAVLVGVCLALFLAVTGLNGLFFSSRAYEALRVAREALPDAEHKTKFEFINITASPPVNLLIVVADLVLVVATIILFAGLWTSP